jgi:rod shape-determining protein MreC
VKGYISKRVIVIVLIALFIAVMSAVGVALSDTASGRLASAVNSATVPVKRGMSSMVDSLEELYGYLYKYDRLEVENQELKDRIAELEEQTREYDAINEENEQLRTLLDFGERNDSYEFDEVTVLTWSASNYNSSFTINKGSDAGLELNDCIITSTGYLIGRITELNKTTATVTTIIDPSTNLGAEIYEISELAVAEGDYRLMQEGKLKLTYLETGTQVIGGYTVVTSGRSGLYPKGLVIGTVESVTKDNEGLEDTAVVVPKAELEQLSKVYVITDFGSKQ